LFLICTIDQHIGHFCETRLYKKALIAMILLTGDIILDAIQRYELIRPILHGEKTVKEIHQETGVPLQTLYYYVKRFREGKGQIESLANKSLGAHSHPNWFTEEDKDKVVLYKIHHPEKSARQIAKELSSADILQISYHSVSDILKQRSLTENFFWINQQNSQIYPSLRK